jgi:hypothetical protein
LIEFSPGRRLQHHRIYLSVTFVPLWHFFSVVLMIIVTALSIIFGTFTIRTR